MRADLAAVLAAVLASGATWFLTRSDRAAPPAQESEVAPLRTEPGLSTLSAPSGVSRSDDRIDQLLRELRAIRELVEAKPTDPSHPGIGPKDMQVPRGAGTFDFLEHASIADFIETSASIRNEAERRLLTVPEETRQQYASLLTQPDSGIGRILPRGKFESLIETRGGGAYWSFATKSNSYDESPDLTLEQGKFRSGFYGNARGEFLDVGGVPLDRVPDRVEVLSPTLSEESRPAWESLWSEPAAFSKGTSSSVTATVGHTYLLRAVLPDEHDHLVAFAVVLGDDNVLTIVGRILKTFPMVSTRRR